jgi:hypothetical protein
MNKLSKLTSLLTLSLALSQASFASDPTLQADRDAVNSSCSAEAATAGCGDKKVGSGLLKCIHAYKKTNKDFKISDGCKEASKKLKADHTAHKAEKEAKKAEKAAEKAAKQAQKQAKKESKEQEVKN